ncbi:MAG: hypothetical protein U0271_42925 [Polyangiaceae bacterium]
MSSARLESFFVVAALFSAAFTVAGCSVDGVDNVFGRPPGDGGGGNGGSSNTTGGFGGVPSNGGAGGDMTTTTTSTTSSTTTSTTTTTSTGVIDAPQVSCNNQECDPGKVCCYNAAAPDFCSLPGGCPNMDGWISIGCNDTTDCEAGAQCCGKWTSQTGWIQFECKSSCSGDENMMCDPLASDCPPGQFCTPSAALGVGYGFCE